MGSFKLEILFALPAIYDSYQFVTGETQQLDMVLIGVAVFASLVGSVFQISEKNLEKRITLGQSLAILSAGAMVAIMGYGVGQYTELWWATAILTSFASYMSLELLHGLKSAVLKIVSFLPDILKDYLRAKYSSNNKPKDHENDNTK